MDSTKRKLQQQFVSALLTSLGAKDRFNIAFCDVQCNWLFDKSTKASAEPIAKAERTLADRLSLGWTNLDRMVQSILTKANKNSHIIYVGDGISTTHDANPQEFVRRLQKLTADKTTGTFHAVSVGNSFESVALKGLASQGGGSVRKIRGESTPQQVAFELLNEIAQPGIRDLRVEFRGIDVAAVYPKQLPNLPIGTQQIIVGRYLPGGNQDQAGEVVVTGVRNGEQVRFAAPIRLAEAEAGNSFIPRLWARAHIGNLLDQGPSPVTQDEIISLSEEFHLITPYTSLLVLESDQDRERFGVKRRFQMRDGERFFTKGRDDGNFELLREQMKRAGDWRLNLRRRTLLELAKLGRNPQQFSRYNRAWNGFDGYAMVTSRFGVVGGMGGGFGGAMGGGGGFSGERVKRLGEIDKLGDLVPQLEEAEEADGELVASATKSELAKSLPEFYESDMDELLTQGGYGLSQLNNESRQQASLGGRFEGFDRGIALSRTYSRNRNLQYSAWIEQLFPSPPAAPKSSQSPQTTWQGRALKISQQLTTANQIRLAAQAGLDIRVRTYNWDPYWRRVSSVTDQATLFAKDRWLEQAWWNGLPNRLSWCSEKLRGQASFPLRGGRQRTATAEDLKQFRPGQVSAPASGYHISYSRYQVELSTPDPEKPNLVRLKLTQSQAPTKFPNYTLVEIDTDRQIVLSQQRILRGKITSTTRYRGFTKVASVHWPTVIEQLDRDGVVITRTLQSVKLLPAAEYGKAYQARRPDNRFVILNEPLPAVRVAERVRAQGKAKLEHSLVLLRRELERQKWQAASKLFAEFAQHLPNQPIVDWAQAELFLSARKNEDARQLLKKKLPALLNDPSGHNYQLVDRLLNRLNSVVDANEFLTMLEQAKPMYSGYPIQLEPQPTVANWSAQPPEAPQQLTEMIRGLSMASWRGRQAQVFQQLGRTAEEQEARKRIATDSSLGPECTLGLCRYAVPKR